jgi:hypothetical protein
MVSFLQTTIDLIRADVMLAFNAFWHLDMRNFQSINEELLTLLSKKEDTISLKDYLSISMIHVLDKLFYKVLANRLASHLEALIHYGQSDFIKGCCVHDNFKFFQASAQLLHARKLPRLLLKVDIARAFDSVAGPFLLEVLRHMGFPELWINWISTLLSMSSTKILLNGSIGERICHTRGLCPGDPLSPMMFLFVMEVLHALIRKVDCWSLLNFLGV